MNLKSLILAACSLVQVALTASAADLVLPAPADTAAIQTAIDTCSREGGGRVILSSGRHVAGTLLLKDNVTLRLEKGAVLAGSLDIADYQLVEPFIEGTGKRIGWCLIGAVDAKNIGIEGPGTIDGRGKELLAARAPADRDKRPALIRFVRCERVVLKEARFQSAAMWMVHLARCKEVNATGLTLHNRGNANNDGFDIDSCDGVHLSGCEVDSSDDSICLKSTYPVPCRNVEVRDCRLASDCGAIKFGTESLGGFENVRIEKCRITKGRLGGIKIFSVDGGIVENIAIKDIEMENVALPIFIRLGTRLKTFHPGDRPKPPGEIRRVVIENVKAKSSASTGVLISGVPGHRIEGVTLRNITLTLPGGGKDADAKTILPEKENAYPEIGMFGSKMPAYGLVARHINGLEVSDFKITTAATDQRPLRKLDDATMVLWPE